MNNKKIKTDYSDKIYEFVLAHAEEFNGLMTEHFNIRIDNFLSEIKKNMISKIERMSKIEDTRGKMTDDNILENIECALKSAFYMHFRYLYNNNITLEEYYNN